MAANPRPIPLGLWIVAFSILQFAFSRLPPTGPQPLNAAGTPSAPGGSSSTLNRPTSAVRSKLDRLTWNGQCVKDRILWRQLPKNLGASKDNTPTECIRRCKEEDEGYAYAGVQFGSECFCGNQPPQEDTIVDGSECDWGCSGDQDLMCGARWRMNVFETGGPLNWEEASDNHNQIQICNSGTCTPGKACSRANFGEDCGCDNDCDDGVWCNDDYDCDRDYPHCDMENGNICNYCETDEHCHVATDNNGDRLPFCNVEEGFCDICSVTADEGCEGETPHCAIDQVSGYAKCVQCRNGGDCGNGTPICQNNNICVQCAMDTDCVSQQQGFGGTCNAQNKCNVDFACYGYSYHNKAPGLHIKFSTGSDRIGFHWPDGATNPSPLPKSASCPCSNAPSNPACQGLHYDYANGHWTEADIIGFGNMLLACKNRAQAQNWTWAWSKLPVPGNFFSGKTTSPITFAEDDVPRCALRL